jgi:hypothetical protein
MNEQTQREARSEALETAKRAAKIDFKMIGFSSPARNTAWTS